GNDPRLAPALPVNAVPKQSTEQRFGVSLQPRVIPKPEWVARMKAIRDAGGEVTPPADDEQDIVIGLRCEYMIPSDLAPESAWPVVGMDLPGIELGRINLADLKATVHEHLAAKGSPFASWVVPQRAASS